MSKIQLFSLFIPLILCAKSPLDPKLEIEHKIINRSDLKNSSGGFRSDATKIGVENELIGFGYQQWSLNWHNRENLPSDLTDNSSDPINKMQAFALSARYPKKFTEKKWLITGVGVSTTHEKELNDSYSATVYSIIMQGFENEFGASYGVAMAYHPVRTMVLPVVGLNYRQRAKSGLTGTLGYPRTYLAYGFTEKWRGSFGVVFNSVLAKLAKNSTIENDGYMEINAYQSDLALRYNASSRLFFEASYRYTPIYQFTTYNSSGNRLKTYQMKPTSGVAFRAGYRF